MLKRVGEIATEFLEASRGKGIRIISYHDTDGVVGTAILIKAFKRLDKRFSLRVVKNLTQEVLEEELLRQKNEVLVFCNIGLEYLDGFQKISHPVFIFDNKKIDTNKLNDKIKVLGPHSTNSPEENHCMSSGACYLFAKTISKENQDLSSFAVIGIVSNKEERAISPLNKEILSDARDLKIKRGLLLYPATRPLRRALEYSTSFYLPGITGNGNGVIKLLKEVEIDPMKSLIELDEEEMSRLITAIIVRGAKRRNQNELVGNLYTLKFFNVEEDVREISVLIEACSRLGFSDVAVSYCLGDSRAKIRAQDIYSEYRHELVSGLKVAERINKIGGKGFVILNARDQIKDAVVGTICSMLSKSPTYDEGTILIGMAYNQDKIKVSARLVGRSGRNIKDLLDKTVLTFRGKHPGETIEFGGHELAAGAMVPREKEEDFISALKENLEVEVIKI